VRSAGVFCVKGANLPAILRWPAAGSPSAAISARWRYGFLNVVGMGLAGPGEAVHQHLAVCFYALAVHLLHLEWCESIRRAGSVCTLDAGGLSGTGDLGLGASAFRAVV
jgi:hypothetical protein